MNRRPSRLRFRHFRLSVQDIVPMVRLHEAGLIKTSRGKIIAQGTDWRFLNEVKKELKG